MSFENYKIELNNALETIKSEDINVFLEILKNIISNQGTVIIAGNGGSFANSLHIAGDFQKTFALYNASFHAVGENFCSISAIANDYCFEESFTMQILPLIKKNIPTLIIFLSGSGNSKNIILAAKKVSKLKDQSYCVKSLSISAYGGGAISALVDNPISLKIKDMEIAEDIQVIIFHYLKQKLIEIFPVKKENYVKYEKRINNGDIV